LGQALHNQSSFGGKRKKHGVRLAAGRGGGGLGTKIHEVDRLSRIPGDRLAQAGFFQRIGANFQDLAAAKSLARGGKSGVAVNQLPRIGRREIGWRRDEKTETERPDGSFEDAAPTS
jgi:hypothetical protein